MSHSPSEIQVTWTTLPEIDRNGVITQYEVFYISTFDFVNGSITANRDTFSVNITGLEEFVVYNVTMRAYTSVGPGPFSDIRMEQTGSAGEYQSNIVYLKLTPECMYIIIIILFA